MRSVYLCVLNVGTGEEAQMAGRTVSCLLGAFLVPLVFACGNGPEAPTPVPTARAATALLKVQVDNICAGRESDIRVYVDRVPMGVTNPGLPGVSRLVAIGEHELSAVSERGTLWGPFPTSVSEDGRLERLGCMPPDAI